LGGVLGSWMYNHVTLKLAAGFDLNFPVLNAAFHLPTRFY